MTENIAQKEKMNIFWDGLTTEPHEIRLLVMKKCGGNKSYLYITNNEVQKIIVEKSKLDKYIP